jgi:hypothetical protein
MPLFFVPMLGLIGIGIAMIRRTARVSVDGGRPEDAAGRLLHWAVGLLSEQRAEWGQAMVGELDHIDGRSKRLRFAFGCVTAALLLPPWGRAAAAVWTMVAIAVGGVALYSSIIVHYGLGGGEWIGAAILAVFLAGFLLAASALLRRPGVAVPGLVGGVFVAGAWLALSGFTFYDQIAPDIVPWHPVIETVVVPFAVGAAGTLWSGDAVIGRRVARLAGISAGLGLFLYGTLAVAVVGAGGPPDDSGWTSTYIVSDRLGNNIVLLLLLIVVTATVGWGGAAAVGAATARMRPEPAGQAASSAMTTEIAVPAWRRTARIVLLGAVVAVALVLAAAGWLRG